jgi:hypothetical protein
MNSRHYVLTLAFFLLAACLVVPTASARADEDQQYGLGLARVTYITGDTLFNSSDTDEWAALSPNFTLRSGDRLWSGDGSKIEVRFSGGAAAWLNDQTELDMVRLDRDLKGNSTYQVALASGEASFATRGLGKNAVFQVDTPNTSVRAYDRAQFRVTSLSDGSSQVGVVKGSIEVETPDGATQVHSGEMVEIDQGGYASFDNLPPRDSWDDWVASRWNKYSRPARSARYLPKDMDDYGYEFDEGGRWVSTPDYGYVWSPAVAVGWSPYSYGRWVWIAGDYVWLPYDPWYAPFHYGRWAFTASVGWCWVPPVSGVAFWSPGFVGWVWGPDYVSWVPLAPREVYYGYGYYGPHSVNVTNVKVVNVTNVYVNARVTNSVVVVNRNNFLAGNIKRVPINQKDNPFLNRGALGTKLIARPPVQELKPARETRFPRPQARLSQKQLPPARLEKPAPFVRQRAIAKGENKSAFQPGRKPPKLEQVLREKGKLKTPGGGAAPEMRGGRPAAPGRGVAPERGKERVAPGGKPAVPETRGGRPAAPERGLAPERGKERVAPQKETPGAGGFLPRGGRMKEAPPAGGGPAAPEKGFAPRGRERVAPERKVAPERGPAPGRGGEVITPERGPAPERGAAPERGWAPERGRDRVIPERGPAPGRGGEVVAPEQGAAPERGRAKVAPEERAPSPGRARENVMAPAAPGGPPPAVERAPQTVREPKWKREQPGITAPPAAPGPGKKPERQKPAPPAQKGEKKEKKEKNAQEGEEKPPAERR